VIFPCTSWTFSVLGINGCSAPTTVFINLAIEWMMMAGYMWCALSQAPIQSEGEWVVGTELVINPSIKRLTIFDELTVGYSRGRKNKQGSRQSPPRHIAEPSTASPPFPRPTLTFSGLFFLRFEPAIISLGFIVVNLVHMNNVAVTGTHLFLIASLLPIFRAALTVSERLTLPICLRFILDGLGSLSIHSGTEEPDCERTLAMLVQETCKLVCACTSIRKKNAYDLRKGASSSVKYVTAFPSLPARPVRPITRILISIIVKLNEGAKK
jgi:hypothetical protein